MAGEAFVPESYCCFLEPCLDRPGPLFPFDPFGFSLIMGVTRLMQNEQPLFRAKVSRHMVD